MRTILITGANRGLGQAAAQRLARAGHRLILTGRDAAKARVAVKGVQGAVPKAQAEGRVVDLASLASVHALADRLLEDGTRIDVLVHNAGVLFPPKQRSLTEDGVELCLQVHAVAPLLLTRRIRSVLARPSRIWWLGSSLHYPGMRGAEVDYRHDDPNLDSRYEPQRAYKNSKLALLWVAYELQRRMSEAEVDVVSPGFVPQTAAAGAQGGFQRFALRRILPHMPFATSLDDSADGLATLFGETPPDEEGGRYFHEWTPRPSSEQSRDEAQARRFWRWACERAGLPEEIEPR